ncbi:hypothetical protein FB645_003817 [Coemansia sp. IMI 203386]|nr:hypothetical protein FB645_003817 [Coemansia sp. IMI 203386]
MNLLRFAFALALMLLATTAFVHAMPVDEASTTALVSPAVSPTLSSSSGVAAAVPPATPENSSTNTHLNIGQVVFNFVSGMLAIVEDTVRGYLSFGTAPNN